MLKFILKNINSSFKYVLKPVNVCTILHPAPTWTRFLFLTWMFNPVYLFEVLLPNEEVTQGLRNHQRDGIPSDGADLQFGNAARS